MRRLVKNQPVLVIYHQNLGFVELKAIFIEYREMDGRQFPVFKSQEDWFDGEITGKECFWLMSHHHSTDVIEHYQKEVVRVQIGVLFMPEAQLKLKDNRIINMAKEQNDKMKNLITKIGFDPRDDSWVEQLAETVMERHWFKFEREKGLIINWDESVQEFNQRHNSNLTTSVAKQLSKKRTRYIMGSYHIRMQGIGDRDAWRKSAKAFELKHRKREERMQQWTSSRDSFPVVKTQKPIEFFSGPYHYRILEVIPDLFTDNSLSHIKAGVELRVVAYDPQDRYIRLDFMPDIRVMICDKVISVEKDDPDYEFIVSPKEIDECLDLKNLV